jgi:hypothetical protein
MAFSGRKMDDSHVTSEGRASTTLKSLVTKGSWSYVLASRKGLRPTWNAHAEHDRMV